jgi:ribonuclease BN (tRNA processing enzyme)
MSEAKVFLVGTGTCRIDPTRGQTSACVVAGTTTYVIDLGFGSLERLDGLGAFDACSTLHIHIFHRHTDHLIGLFPLLQSLSRSDDRRHLAVKRVVIHATNEVCDLIEKVRSIWGPEETQLLSPMRGMSERVLEFRPGPDHQDWSYSVEGLDVRSVHLADYNNHGVAFELNGKRYAFTADATVLSDTLVEFCKGVDICAFDFGHMTNVRQEDGSFKIDLTKATELLSRANPRTAYACHVYLRHLQERVISRNERAQETERVVREAGDLARSHGFTGRLLAGADGQQLDAC